MIEWRIFPSKWVQSNSVSRVKWFICVKHVCRRFSIRYMFICMLIYWKSQTCWTTDVKAYTSKWLSSRMRSYCKEILFQKLKWNCVKSLKDKSTSLKKVNILLNNNICGSCCNTTVVVFAWHEYITIVTPISWPWILDKPVILAK